MSSLPTSSGLELLDDEQLVARALGGAREAFNVLVVRHERRLFRFLCRGAATEADAEDAMQQAMVKAYLNLAKYDPRWRFTTWLFTIALRELRTIRRTRGRGPTVGALDAANEAAAPANGDVLAAMDGPGDLWRAARRVLKDPAYTALWLRYGEDLAVRDVARVMGRPRIWVSVTLHRACAAVRAVVTHGNETKADSVAVRHGRKQTIEGAL
jgi:RNA polymerase sigma-70 factor, ECF subfamily